MSMIEYSHPVSANAHLCPGMDRMSVESRFGLRDCAPRVSGGNRCAFDPPAWARDAQGRPVLGALMVLADHILGELPNMYRPQRTWSLTAELTLDVVGELPANDVLYAEAIDISQGSEWFVQCRIMTASGNVVAVGNSRMVYVPAAGAELMEASAQPSSAIEAAAIASALGLEYHDLADGAQVSVPDPQNWMNGFGIMHGGVSACVTELVASAAISACNPDLSTVRVHTNYLRPVAADRPFVAEARLQHAGRSSAVVEVRGRGGSGELCTLSTVTARRRRPAA